MKRLYSAAIAVPGLIAAGVAAVYIDFDAIAGAAIKYRLHTGTLWAV